MFGKVTFVTMLFFLSSEAFGQPSFSDKTLAIDTTELRSMCDCATAKLVALSEEIDLIEYSIAPENLPLSSADSLLLDKEFYSIVDHSELIIKYCMRNFEEQKYLKDCKEKESEIDVLKQKHQMLIREIQKSKGID